MGRPLRRELARVLGLDPSECPQIVRGIGVDDGDGSGGTSNDGGEGSTEKRAVTLPGGVRNYVVPCGSTVGGGLLADAAAVYKALPSLKTTPEDDNGDDRNISDGERRGKRREGGRRTLLVLSRESGLSVRNALGALRHFGCVPEPRSLLDELESGGTAGERY